MISLKAPSEIARMRDAGQVVGEILATVAEAAQPGVKTRDLDALAANIMRQHGATSSFLHYQPELLSRTVRHPRRHAEHTVAITADGPQELPPRVHPR